MDRFHFRRTMQAGQMPTHADASRPPSPESYWWRFWKESYSKAVWWLLAIALAVNVAEAYGYFDRWELPGFDVLVQSQAQKVPTDIFVVEITDQDYENKDLFDSKSPLGIEPVFNLLDAVASGHPSVIGVDLDTRDTQLLPRDIKRLQDLDAKTKVVWAQVPIAVDSTDGSQRPILLYQPILGGQVQDPSRMGVVRFPLDRDGVVRKYEVQFDLFSCASSQPPKLNPCLDAQTARLPDPLPVFAFPRAIVKAFNPSKELTTRGEEYLNFSGSHQQYQIVQASEFLKNKTSIDLPENQRDLLKGKIVLVGGVYAAARDQYRTAIGQIDGIELLASAIESEINGGISPVGHFWEGIVDCLLGTIVVLIYFQFRNHPWLSLGLAIVALFVFPFFASFAFFHFWKHWLSFVPVMAGMLIHQQVEAAALAAELRKDLKTAEAKVEALEAERERSRASLLREEVDIDRTSDEEEPPPPTPPSHSEGG